MISEAAELREKVGPGGIFGRDSSAGTIVPGDEVGGNQAFAVELFFQLEQLYYWQGTIKSLSGIGTDQGTMVEHGTGKNNFVAVAKQIISQKEQRC